MGRDRHIQMSARNALLFQIALYAKRCEEREGSGHL